MRTLIVRRLGFAVCAVVLTACGAGESPTTTASSTEMTSGGDWSSPLTAALSLELTETQTPDAAPAVDMPTNPAARSTGLTPTEQRLFSSLTALNTALGNTGFPDYQVFDGPIAFAGYDVDDDTQKAVPMTLLVLGDIPVPKSSPITVDWAVDLPATVRTTDSDLLDSLLGTQFDLDFTISGDAVPVFAFRSSTAGVSTDDNLTSPTWSPGSTAVHELFHNYQGDQQWWSDKRTDEVYLPDDIIDTDGVVLATMEEQALRSALDGTDVFDPERTGRARAMDRDRVLQELQRFLALRSARVAGNPELAEYLDVTETEEGTAEWVERNVALWAGDASSFEQLQSQLGRVGNRAYYGDGSTYNEGLAVLTILDALGTDWRSDITSTGIHEIATAAYGQQLPSRAEAEQPFDIAAITTLVEGQNLADQPRGRR